MSSPALPESDIPRLTPGVRTLIALSAAVAFVQWLVFKGLDPYLGFNWDQFVTKGHWWSAATYLFLHDGFWPLAINLYALFLFGPRLEHAWGTRRFILFYLFCGIGTLLCYVAFIHNDVLIGSSGAVFGVMTAYAMQWPDDEIFFFGVLPMRVWTMVLLVIGTVLALGLYTSATGGPSSLIKFSSLGGALAAWFYIRTPEAPSLDQLRHHVARVPDEDDPPRAVPRVPPRSRERGDPVNDIVARSNAISAKQAAAAVAPQAPSAPLLDVKPEDINRVLDKISEQGLDSLSADERRMLEDASRRLRGRRS